MRTKSENKRQGLVAAATEVFVERGYEAASMSEISARAGGSKATLYNYFPSKEALFLDVMRSLTAELSSAYVRLQP
ncbi:TetR/AcrR family transcriptional regulator, partial [Chromobacterium vaccinii]